LHRQRPPARRRYQRPQNPDRAQSASIPSPYVLTIGEVTTEHDGDDRHHPRVNQPAGQRPGQPRSAISLSPAIKFTAEPTEDGFTIRSDNFDQSKSYTLTSAKACAAASAASSTKNIATNITFGELEPAISFANDKGVYLSGKGAKNIEVRIVNVPRVKVVISKIYENNLLAAQHSNYRPAGNDRQRRAYPSSEGGEGEDEASVTISSDDDLTLGDVIYEQEIDTRTLPRSSQQAASTASST
jgi:hypothetical protein